MIPASEGGWGGLLRTQPPSPAELFATLNQSQNSWERASSGAPTQLPAATLPPSSMTPEGTNPLGPLGSSSSQHMRTLELVLQKSHASFWITFSPPGANPKPLTRLADYYGVDMPGVRCKCVNFGAGKSPGSPDW